MRTEWRDGLRDGLPIAVGYFAVSFSFGLLATQAGLTAFQAGLISLTNLTSAGQFAGLTIITAGAGLGEMALTQLVINQRYALMSLALGQKLGPQVGTLKRCLIAFVDTDEIFAVAMGRPGRPTPAYMGGLGFLPLLGWTGGTLTGALASGVLPAAVISALGIALYCMFVAVVAPVARRSRPVLAVVGIALVCSCLMSWVPLLKQISAGTAIILCTVAAAALGAWLFPVEEPAQGGDAT